MNGDPDVVPGGRLLRASRALLWPVLVLAVANGGFLYLLPRRAETDYAWPIRPAASAMFLGAGYVAGILAPALGIFVVRRWRSLEALIWGFIVLGIVASFATFLHADRFRWSYALTWIWTAVYVGIPPTAAWVIWHQRRRHPEPSLPPDPRVRRLRPVAGAFGVACALVGVVLLAAPSGWVSAWAWPITPLLARVFAAWYLLAATTLVVLALRAARPHELVVPSLTLAAWSALLLPIPLLDAASMRTGGAGMAVFVVGHALMLVVFGVIAVAACGWTRRSGESV